LKQHSAQSTKQIPIKRGQEISEYGLTQKASLNKGITDFCGENKTNGAEDKIIAKKEANILQNSNVHNISQRTLTNANSTMDSQRDLTDSDTLKRKRSTIAL
jgi:hypothetical protein